jgi:hypothetical protein
MAKPTDVDRDQRVRQNWDVIRREELRPNQFEKLKNYIFKK